MPESPASAPFSEPALRWPLWLEEYRLDDACSAAAYEQTPPAYRAALKTGLAMAHMHFGRPQGRQRQERCDQHLGFWEHCHRAPVPWALVLFTPAYTAAARLTAACAAMLLADVPQIGAVCLGGIPQASALVSLELSGVEDIFCLDAPAVEALCKDYPASGRMVFLHRGELAATAEAARRRGICCHEESAEPRLLLAAPEYFDLDILAFAQGEALSQAAKNSPARTQADTVSQAPTHATPPASAVYTTAENLPFLPPLHAAQADGQAQVCAPLTLTPGCEGFWLHAGLTPSFFMQDHYIFGQL